MIAPCMNCKEREIGCHSHCEKYSGYRAICDKIKAAKVAEQIEDEAFRERGDKIRRDVRKYGVYKTGKS